MENKSTWLTYSKKKREEADAYAASYMEFLNDSKTEREGVDTIVNMVEEQGFVELDRLIRDKKTVKAGDMIYYVAKNKAIVLMKVGMKAFEEGMNILAAHLDSPRLDIKQNPLYEDGGFAYLDTHYYGGIKKYQWVTTPLALHGVAVKKDGTTIDIQIGEKEDDPVVFISDLLVHIAAEQMERKADQVVKGEAMDVVIGNMPFLDDTDEQNGQKDLVKKNILSLLKEYYDMEEEDFISAEIEVVPAARARVAGLDRSMIMAYGQDDKVCVYAEMKALMDMGEADRTCTCVFVDKEEIGSVGASSMSSKFFENMVAEVTNLKGEYNELCLKRCMMNSNFISADVSSAYDPMFADSFEKKNVAYLGNGIAMNKYTGARGKSGANDANAEFIAALRNIFSKESVCFQTAEYGRVDLGGSGTISHILAEYGMNVVDCGVAVLNMHAPFEVTSKADIYETKRAYQAFLQYC